MRKLLLLCFFVGMAQRSYQTTEEDHSPTVFKTSPKMVKRFYVVKKGDTLSFIAYKVYGKAKLWPKLYQKNQEFLKNPHLIFPGERILTHIYVQSETKLRQNSSMNS